MNADFDASRPWTGRVELESVCRNPDQPRVHFDAAGLVKLGRSMKRKQVVPCPVIPHVDEARPAVRWMLVDGERRGRTAGDAMARLRAVAGPAPSSRATNGRYVVGRIHAALRAVLELKVLGPKLLAKLTKKEAEEGLEMLQKVRVEVVPLCVELENVAG